MQINKVRCQFWYSLFWYSTRIICR